jgi:prepilin-type N-terminal cleavage/methylation domain-containing protein
MKTSRGFTLIEVIVTLTVLAIACTMVITYIGTSFNQSAVPAGLVGRQYVLVQQMELITSQYRQQINNDTLNLSNFSTYIANNYNGSANALLTNLTSTNGNYTTGNVLLVTLTNSTANYTQTLQSIFTQ